MPTLKLPHWAQLVLAFLVVAITWIANQQASGQLVLPSTAVTVLTTIKTVIGMFSDSVQNATSQKRALAAINKGLVGPGGGGLLVLLAFGLVTMPGCATLSATPTVPVTPDNSAQVTACQGYAEVHNGSAIGGIAAGAVTAGLGSAGALVLDGTAQRAMAISAVGTGAVGAILATVTGLEAANYQQGSCSEVLGPLPLSTRTADGRVRQRWVTADRREP